MDSSVSVCLYGYIEIYIHILTATGDPFPRIDGKVGLVLCLSRPTKLTSINTTRYGKPSNNKIGDEKRKKS